MAEMAGSAQGFRLAQVNVARMRYPREDARMGGFFEAIERINGIADRSEGFVWRLDDEAADAEARRLFADERLLFNLSLWRDLEALRAFVYQSEHLHFVRRRNEWFEPWGGPSMVLWWQAEGVLPTVMEARHRLEMLRLNGPCAEAFTFARQHEPEALTVSG